MSLLRITGILFGIACLALSFYRLRYKAEKRIDVWLLSIFGLALSSVSLFPSLVNLPAEMISMRDNPGGRVITLLLISSAMLWILLIYERGKSANKSLQLDKLVRVLAVQNFFEKYGIDILDGSITVLIPAYNEEGNLPSVLSQIPTQIDNIIVKVLVIDDGSSDNTGIISEKLGAIVAKNPTNRGGGAALKVGYDIIKKSNPIIIVTMDADGQHNPQEMPALVEALLNDQADFVIGSRALGSSSQFSKTRLFGVIFFSRFINLLLGTNITDCSSGYRAFNMQVIKDCILFQEQYHTSELIIEASKRNFRIQERPVEISERLNGYSKKGSNWIYGLLFLRAVLKTWLR